MKHFKRKNKIDKELLRIRRKLKEAGAYNIVILTEKNRTGTAVHMKGLLGDDRLIFCKFNGYHYTISPRMRRVIFTSTSDRCWNWEAAADLTRVVFYDEAL